MDMAITFPWQFTVEDRIVTTGPGGFSHTCLLFQQVEGEAGTLLRSKSLYRKPRYWKRHTFAQIAYMHNSEVYLAGGQNPWNQEVFWQITTKRRQLLTGYR